MITRENIIHFYTKYKENLKKEDQIQENLLKAEDPGGVDRKSEEQIQNDAQALH